MQKPRVIAAFSFSSAEVDEVVDHDLAVIVAAVAVTRSVSQLDCGSRKQQSNTHQQEEDCDACKPRSGA